MPQFGFAEGTFSCYKSCVQPEDERIRLVEALQRATPRIWVTPAVCVVLVLCFAAVVLLSGASPVMMSAGDLIHYGANTFAATIGRGEWWRLLTATLLHAGLLHLVLNAWAFWNVGTLTERLFGNWAFLFVYLASGVGGSVASLHWNQASVSVGASGAIFGIYGALLAFVLRNPSAMPATAVRTLRTTTLGFIGLNLFIGLTLPFVDNAAHAGGVSVGFVSGWFLSRDLRQPSVGRGARLVATVAALAVAVLSLKIRFEVLSDTELGTRASAPVERLLAEGTSRLRRNDAYGAIRVFDKALSQQPNQPEALFGRAIAHLAAEHFRAARDDLEAAKTHGADASRLKEPVCQATWGTGDIEAAVEACDLPAAREVETSLIRARALAAGGRFLEAHQAIDTAAERLQSLDSPRIVATRAAIRLREGFTADAVGLCRKSSVVLEPRALALCIEVLRDARAPDAIDSLLEAATSGLGRQVSGLAHLRALALVSLGEKSRALSGLENVDAKDAMGLNNRAFVKILAGDSASALTDVDASLALEPTSAPALGTRCWAKAGLGQKESAIADCEAALALAPGTDADEGMLAYLQGNGSRAVFFWQMAQKGDLLSAPLYQPFIDRVLVPGDGGLP